MSVRDVALLGDAIRLMNAPATFQRMMDQLLRGLEFVRVYLDDIFVYSQTKNEHIQHIECVLNVLERHGLKVKLKKSFFMQPEVILLGHIVD